VGGTNSESNKRDGKSEEEEHSAGEITPVPKQKKLKKQPSSKKKIREETNSESNKKDDESDEEEHSAGELTPVSKKKKLKKQPSAKKKIERESTKRRGKKRSESPEEKKKPAHKQESNKRGKRKVESFEEFVRNTVNILFFTFLLITPYPFQLQQLAEKVNKLERVSGKEEEQSDDGNSEIVPERASIH
jgi:hypothetical protein